MKANAIAILVFLFIVTAIPLSGQSEFTFTKAFEKKLEEYKLEYQPPAKMWLHPVPYQDEYDDYDLVLYSEDQDLEVRYIFRDSSSPIALSEVPHLEFYRSIIDFASNENETNQIIIQDMLPETAKKVYNADWCLTADFTPKASISMMPKGKILGIYKKDTGLIFCVVFYKNELSEYFELPIKFMI